MLNIKLFHKTTEACTGLG